MKQSKLLLLVQGFQMSEALLLSQLDCFIRNSTSAFDRFLLTMSVSFSRCRNRNGLGFLYDIGLLIGQMHHIDRLRWLNMRVYLLLGREVLVSLLLLCLLIHLKGLCLMLTWYQVVWLLVCLWNIWLLRMTENLLLICCSSLIELT